MAVSIHVVSLRTARVACQRPHRPARNFSLPRGRSERARGAPKFWDGGR